MMPFRGVPRIQIIAKTFLKVENEAACDRRDRVPAVTRRACAVNDNVNARLRARPGACLLGVGPIAYKLALALWPREQLP